MAHKDRRRRRFRKRNRPKADNRGKRAKPRGGKPTRHFSPNTLGPNPAEDPNYQGGHGHGGGGGGGSLGNTSVNATLGGAGVAGASAAADDKPGGRSPAQAAQQAIQDYGPSGSSAGSSGGSSAARAARRRRQAAAHARRILREQRRAREQREREAERAQREREREAEQREREREREQREREREREQRNKDRERDKPEKPSRHRSPSRPQRPKPQAAQGKPDQGHKPGTPVRPPEEREKGRDTGKPKPKPKPKADDRPEKQKRKDSPLLGALEAHGIVAGGKPKEIKREQKRDARKTRDRDATTPNAIQGARDAVASREARTERLGLPTPRVKKKMRKLRRKEGKAAGPSYGGADLQERAEAQIKERRQERKGTRKFLGQRERGRRELDNKYPKYVQVAKLDEAMRVLENKSEKLGRPLTREEADKIVRRRFREERPNVKRSRKLLERFGAVPEQGGAFWEQVERAAKHAPSKGTRQRAKRLLAKRGEVRSDINLGYFKPERKKGGLITPAAKEKAQQKALLEEYADREHQTFGEVLGTLGEQVKQLPQGAIDTIQVGWDLVVNKDTDGLREMAASVKEDPAVTFFVGLANGNSFKTSAEQFAQQVRRNPLGAVADATVVAGAVSKAALRAQHGSSAGAVRAARPDLHPDARDAQARFRERGPVGRVRDVNRRRRENQRDVEERANQAKRDAKAKGGKRGEHFEPRPVAPDAERQFYSQSTPVRAAQKARETVRAVRGKDPFAPTGRRAERIFARKGERAKRRLSPAGLALGATVVADIGRTALRADRHRFVPRNKLRTAAFELRYDGTVRRGSEVEDLDRYMGEQRRALREGDPEGIHAHNLAMAQQLMKDLTSKGEKAMLRDRGMGSKVEQLRRTGAELDEALVRTGYITAATAAKRRSLGGAIARGEVIYRKKGEEFGEEFDVEGKAAEDGWYARDGTEFRGDGRGAYVDYRAVHERGPDADGQAQMELAGQVAGRIRDKTVINERKLGDEHVRASLEKRARTIGELELRRELMRIGPDKGLHTAEEGAALARQLSKKGEVQYTTVASGIGKGSDEAGAPDLRRAAAEGEKVYVVPKAVVDMHAKMTKPPGRIRSVAQFTMQKFVSAVLPFSTSWHAGNQLDLITRLAVAGGNPLRNAAQAGALKAAMAERDASLGRQMFSWTQAHFGSRQSVIKEANLAAALGPYKNRLAQGAARAASDFQQSRAGHFVQPLLPTQKGFDVATMLERPWVAMAQGRAARLLARDLGIEVRDHAKLAQRLADQVVAEPRLLEDFGRRTVEIIGDYSSSPFEQQVVQNILPFWSWMKEANRFIFYTFPAKHPIKFALAAQIGQMSYDAAERLGLHEFGNKFVSELEGFTQFGIPMDPAEGWIMPTAPFTSLGESAKLLEDPWTYLASAPFPYLQRAGSVATGHRSYDSFGALVLKELTQGDMAKQLGIGGEMPNITLPGFKPPSDSPVVEFQGDRSDGVLSELIQAFVPGGSQVYQAMVGGFPGPTSTIFDPEAVPGTEVPWYQNRALNPFGLVRDLDAIDDGSGEPKRDPKTEAEKYRERHSDLKPGTVMYTAEGERLRFNGKNWVTAGNPRGRHDGTRTGRGKDGENRRGVRQEALRRLVREFPEINSTSDEAVGAIVAASRKYDVPPEVLASIYRIESNFGTNQGPSSAGALGHMQFMPATWEAYGVDATGDGKADPANAVDAIHSAANYLAASGASEDLRGAIFAYNHADWYVDEVLAGAEEFRSKDWKHAGTGAAHASNGGGMKPLPAKTLGKYLIKAEGDEDIKHLAPELQRALVELAKKSGQPVTVNSGNRSIAEQRALYEAYLNGTGNLAAPPGESNHNFGQAADIELVGNQEALLNDVGLIRPVTGEPWHVELANPGSSVTGSSGGGSWPSLPSYSGGSGPAPAVSAVPASAQKLARGVGFDSEKAGRRRRLHQAGLKWRVELMLSLLNDEITVLEFVQGLRP